MVKKMRDKGETRVLIGAITSFSKDYDLTPPNGKVDTIILTIGSAVRKLTYNKTEDRDADFQELEESRDVGSNLR